MSGNGRLDIREAARALTAGGVLAYPTESCFGLGCDPWNRQAVERILAAKGRAEAKGLILIGGLWEHLAPFMGRLTVPMRRRIARHWPGPVTFLLPPAPEAPAWIRGAHPRIALRWTAHPHAARLCRAYGGALVSTSANREGEPPAITAVQCEKIFGAELDGYMRGKVGPRAQPSAIIDAVTGVRIR
ncbi:L-threonylcarbamoyladenylate synthase [Thiohalorhabdus methylotrophus]|uniref:Threonylcarbamoyl-AMP synthase n=1 Tax=Thiohalorhabdus methylotrophus TaxID=3242694 RepID=A0ABV4TUA1_9GAMM